MQEDSLADGECWVWYRLMGNKLTDKEQADAEKFTVPSFIFGDPEICMYCGAMSEDIDHVFPVGKRAFNSQELEIKPFNGVRTYSCVSCMKALGNHTFKTFAKRLKFVLKFNREQSKKFGRKASWSDREINALDYTLQTYVRSKQNEMRALDAKVTWMSSLPFRIAIRNLSRVRELDRADMRYREWLADYFSGFY
jgi:hypothetical protein